ncbi:MAG: glycosyltransferase family 39 protein [Anaerolineae bacterium]|nr:glycosyltransferase family 39 protein [Anaerolineae bacterium]MDW8067643.1 glycosyltransferase family 39 protein [Anaerolineae bacterium]
MNAKPRGVVLPTLLLILLLAAALRFYRLDAQSFWNDEGNAIRAAQRPIPLVIAAAAGDIHPPGYYLLLHFWRIPTGDREFAVRTLSVFIGLLAVALTGRLGQRMLGAGVGAGAALLAALSPLAVYYSQEARMYGLLGLIAVAATDLLWSLLHRPRRATALLYALVAAAGLYTHYSFPFLLVAHNLLVFGVRIPSGLRRRCREEQDERPGLSLRTWIVLQMLVGLLYLPWLPAALRATGWPSAGRGYTLGAALLDIFRALTVGITLETEPACPVLIGAGVLLALSLWPRRNAALAGATLALWLLVPLALIFAFDLYKPAYLKFLLAVLPAFHILLAAGIHRLVWPFRLPRPLLSLILGALYALMGAALLPSLRNLYFNPTYARDNYRQIAADIEALGRPGDGVLLNAPNQWEVFTYYYQGDLPLYPAPYHPTPERMAEWLAPILSSHQRLFVLYWGDREADPERRMENLLADGAYPAWSRWYGRVRLALYGLGPLPAEPWVAVRAHFGPEILLHGYTVGAGPFAPGDVLPVTLFWEATAPPGRYKVFLHLLDAAGRLVAQNDAEPRGDLSPTFIWSVGERVTDRHGVYLPPELPPGRYRLVAGMYRTDTGERLPIVQDGTPAGDALELDIVTVDIPHIP